MLVRNLRTRKWYIGFNVSESSGAGSRGLLQMKCHKSVVFVSKSVVNTDNLK